MKPKISLSDPTTVALAFTGASGLPFGLRLGELLIAGGCRLWLMLSKPARLVYSYDCVDKLPSGTKETQKYFAERWSAPPGMLEVFGESQWTAPLASGSTPPDALVVCPCTSGTLAAMAAGLADTLILRAADVVLKERKDLILMPREMPFSAIHLENMLKLARAGAVIMPPVPAFYTHPKTIGDIVDFVVARVLDQLGLPHDLQHRWCGGETETNWG